MTVHTIVVTFNNGTSVVHNFPTERYTIDNVRDFVIDSTTVPSVTQQDITLADGRCASWKRGYGWTELYTPTSNSLSDEYDALTTREAKAEWFAAHKGDLKGHVKWTGQDNPYGKRVHYVKLDAFSSQWSDTLLIDYCDNGPNNFGGKVTRSPGNGEATVTVYID